MRVGISSTPLMHLDGSRKQYDGIGVYTSSLMNALKTNTEVRPIYFKPIEELFQPIPQSMLQKQPCATNPIIRQYFPLRSYDNLEKSIDIFHSTDYMVPRFKRIPVIATLHDAIMIKHTNWANPKRRTLKNYLLKKLSHNAQHIITISNAVKYDIVDHFGISDYRVSVIYHGLSNEWLETLAPNKIDTALQKHDLAKERYFLFVGTLQPRKNIARILKAYQQLPQHIQDEFKLVFIGKIGWLDKETYSQIERLVSTGNLKWLQYIDSEDVRALYQASKLVLFPSLSEGFGFPIIEGFASKTPVITSESGATAETAGDSAYLVDPESVEHIAHAIKEITEDDTLRNKLIDSGYERAKTFTWERCAEKTKKVYDIILGQ
ncbi:MAG: glycosyltransferase family 4 protein [Gammaproteobacteria bacterium]